MEVFSVQNIADFEKLLQAIGECDNIEQLKNLRSSNSDSNLKKMFWENRKIALETTDEVQRQQAITKCYFIAQMMGASIPIRKAISRFTCPHGLKGIFISIGAKVGTGCTIFQNVTIGSNTLPDSKSCGYPTIGNNCYIGAGAAIIGNIHIGNNVRIGANCIVTQDVPDNCVVVMNRPIIIQKKELKNTFYTAEELQELQEQRARQLKEKK